LAVAGERPSPTVKAAPIAERATPPAYLLLAIFLLSCVSAEEVSANPATLVIPDGTPIELRLAKTVSSAHARLRPLGKLLTMRAG